MKTLFLTMILISPTLLAAGEVGLSCGPSETEILLYKEASKSSPEISRVACASRVWAFETTGGWTKVRTLKGDEGYMMTASLSDGSPAPAGNTPAPVKTTPNMQPTNNPKKPFPAGAAFFIEDMEEDLDGFLRAEIVKEHLPIKLVLAKEQADFVITGESQQESNRSWHEGWLTPTHDHDVGNVTAIHRESNQIVWASEAGDRSLWWGAMKRGGVRKVADRLVNNLKDAIQK